VDEVGSADILLCEGLRFNRRHRLLFRHDKERGDILVEIGQRTLDVLIFLVERRGALVSKNEIIDALWSRAVSFPEANLNIQISRLRKILDQNRKDGSCIQTVTGRGYCFIGTVRQANADVQADAPAIPETSAGQRPRLSIVVLPFANLSEGQEQQYFADGITDDLTTDLSRIDGMFVISRNTAFTYRDRRVDTKQIGRELGVRYVLEGSVRRARRQVRVNAQLIDAETDAHLWADRLDCEIVDLFVLQNEITTRIAMALNLALVNAEAARPTPNPDAQDYIFRGRAVASGKPPSADNCGEAIGLFERALIVDPTSLDAQSWLAIVLVNRLLDFPSSASDGDIKRADELATKVVAASPRTALPHYAKGQVLRVQKLYQEAIAEYEAVLALNRNWVGAIFALGWCKFHVGSIDEIIPLLEQVIRLSPRDPYMGIWYARIGIAHLLQSRIDEAITWLEKARTAIPSRPFTRSSLAVAYALKGKTELAAAEIAEARRLSPDGRYSSIARLKEVGYLGVPKIRTLYETIYLAGYRKAGVPEG
jgi:adenylate cyclase